MRLAALTALALLPALCPAKIHYINQGVKYHIGDNRYELSEDSSFVGAHPVVGEEWIQAFRVSERDKVKVRVGNIWGVDDCGYCKILVSISGRDMGRITQANNHEPFDTLDPLAASVDAGQVYYLQISSYGFQGSSDDFVFSDVTVETVNADVTFLQPGPVIKMPDDPMPRFFEPQNPVSTSDCGQLVPQRNWGLGWAEGRPKPAELRPLDQFAESGVLATLEPGQSLDFSFTLSGGPMNEERVDHALEILANGAAGSGWVFQLHDRVGGLYHGNLKLRGRYSSKVFKAQGLDKAGLNPLRLEYCRDGSLRLSLRGRELERRLEGIQGPQLISARALGLPVSIQGN